MEGGSCCYWGIIGAPAARGCSIDGGTIEPVSDGGALAARVLMGLHDGARKE